jgi:colicin import membrane protein
MPRQLKTYVTTSGFFELAVAAPTMKAAIEIWGASPDIFRRGYAKLTDDPSIIKATMAKPGVVLQRGVGAKSAFKEKANLADIPLADKVKGKTNSPPKSEPAKAEQARAKRADAAASQKAARLYELAQKRREREGARAEAAEIKVRERRGREIEKAESALEAAREAHKARMAAIERKRADIERDARDEGERWRAESQRLEDALRKARD